MSKSVNVKEVTTGYKVRESYRYRLGFVEGVINADMILSSDFVPTIRFEMDDGEIGNLMDESMVLEISERVYEESKLCLDKERYRGFKDGFYGVIDFDLRTEPLLRMTAIMAEWSDGRIIPDYNSKVIHDACWGKNPHPVDEWHTLNFPQITRNNKLARTEEHSLTEAIITREYAEELGLDASIYYAMLNCFSWEQKALSPLLSSPSSRDFLFDVVGENASEISKVFNVKVKDIFLRIVKELSIFYKFAEEYYIQHVLSEQEGKLLN